MLRKPQQVQQTIEPQNEVKERNSHFQIVKLEERIAPRPCSGGHLNPHGKYVGHYPNYRHCGR